MTNSCRTFLTFQGGVGLDAVHFYTSLFEDSEIVSLHTYDAEGPGPEGTLLTAHFRIGGQDFLASDSFINHEWDFTPAVAVWVEADSEDQFERIFDALSDAGKVHMPPDNYGFSRRFAWTDDRFGVSWQLSLE